MSGERIFKLIVKNEGAPSINGLKYIYKNIDIINEMGIRIKITTIDSDLLDREMVDSFNSRGITSFPAIITDNGKVKNGVEQIKDLFERNKKSYNQWISQQTAEPNAPPRDRGPEYAFGNDEQGFSGAAMNDYYAREMNFDAFKRDQKQQGDGGVSEGFSGESDDYNRRIAEQFGRRKAPAPSKSRSSFSGGDDDDADLDAAMHNSNRRGGALSEPGNNILPRSDDVFESRFMEGVDDKAYAGDY